MWLQAPPRALCSTPMSAKKPAELPLLNIPAVPLWYETDSQLDDPLAYFSSDYSDQEPDQEPKPKTTVTKAVHGQTAKPVSLPATSEPSSNSERPDGGVLNMEVSSTCRMRN